MTLHLPASVAFQLGDRNLDVCNSGAECHFSEAVSEPIAVLLAVAFSAALLIGFTYLSQARETCDTERYQTRAEQKAFEQFEDRLRAVDPSTVSSALTVDSGVQSLSTDDTNPELDQIRAAYRETVMAVSHYEEEYGDTLAESIAEEFGPDIAAVVCTGQTFSPQLRHTLVSRTSRACTRRDELLTAVNAEQEMVDAGASKLNRLNRQRDALLKHVQNDPPIAALTDVWTRLCEIEDQIGTELAERQEFIRDPPLRVCEEISSLQEYLYSSLDISYPLLTSGAELGNRIRENRRHISRTIAHFE